MITQWRLFNFKSVSSETDLQLAPLTVFAGANSSGKSTFLQSILLVAQTLAHKVSSRSVVLNGALVRLGQFDDIRTAESPADQIVIGWTCRPSSALRRLPHYFMRNKQSVASVSCEIAFDTKDDEGQRETAQIQPLLFSSRISVSTRDPEAGDRSFYIAIRRAPLQSDESKRKWIDAAESEELMARGSLKYEVEIDPESLEEIREDLPSAQPVGCVLRHFLPQQLALGVDMVEEGTRAILSVSRGHLRHVYRDRQITVPTPVVRRILQLLSDMDYDVGMALPPFAGQQSRFGDQPVPLQQLNDTLWKLPPLILMEIRRRLAEDDAFERFVRDSVRALWKGRGEKPAVVPFRAPSSVTEAIRYIDQFFAASVRYLGPLRDEPKSLYPLSPTADPTDVGLKGEQTAAVLELHKDRPVRYIPPSAFVESDIEVKPVRRSLQTAVIEWLRYLGMAEHVESSDKGKFGHELTVRTAGSKQPYDLTHVGVGVSQVLPILVVSLLAAPNTTLIFEQPELHLHPKVQTLLADFFLSMTQLDKQCLVETHSDYIINRIRFRVAASVKANPWMEAVKVYFVGKAEHGSSFREVNINEFGAILDWPEGFFDQSQREAEAILRAAVSKRRTKKGTQS